MVTKDIYLRKKLIKKGIIAFFILVLLGIGGWLISDTEDTFTEEKGQKEGENNKIRSEYGEIKTLLGQQFQINTIYTTYSASHNTDFTINRETAASLLASLCAKNHLANITIGISPIQTVSPAPFQLKSSELVRSDISMTFGAVTDNSVYNFIESVERTLPGITLVHELKLSHTGVLDKNTLVALSAHKINPLVTSEISFYWFGLQPKADKSKPPTPNRRPNE